MYAGGPPPYAPPPARDPSTRGAPQFVAAHGGTEFEENEFSSVKIAEARGWRALFPDIPDNEGRGCCGKFKFVIWAIIIIALVAAAIGLSITMVVIHDNNMKESDGPYLPPGVSPTPSGGGGSGDKSPTPSPLPDTDGDGKLEIMGGTPPFTVPSGYTALWWDEFNGNALDMKYWNYDTGYGKDYGLWAWGNQEQQYYTPNNVKVTNGVLTVNAQREVTELPDGFKFNYTSGRINSKGKAGFYGGMTTSDGRKWDSIRIEASVKAPEPCTTGLWAAYWMLPTDMRYGVWASSGEIDMYEMKNEFDKCNIALHYGGPWPKLNKRYNMYNPRPGGGTFSDDFTTVTLDWSPTKLSIGMNGEEQLAMQNKAVDPNGYYSDAIGAGPSAPYDIPFYFVINLSVGGRYPGNATDATLLPNAFTLDYIRVFGKPT